MGQIRDPNLEWTDASIQDCGIGCNYLRANENLSLQARYITLKMQDLDDQKQKWEKAKVDAAANSGIPKPDFIKAMEDEIRNSMAGFCLDQATDTEDCFKRYWQAQMVALQVIRTAIATNNTEYSSLRLGAKPSDPNWSPGLMPELDPNNPSALKKPQVTSVITLDDVAKEYDNSEALNLVSSEKYHNWLKELPKKPSQDEFAVFKKVQRYPGVPGSEELQVAVYQADGKTPLFDKKAYAAAVKEYELRIANTSYAAGFKELAAKHQVLTKSVKFKVGTSETSKRAFANARQEMIEAAHLAMRKVGIAAPGKTPLGSTQRSAASKGAASNTGVGRSDQNGIATGGIPLTPLSIPVVNSGSQLLDQLQKPGSTGASANSVVDGNRKVFAPAAMDMPIVTSVELSPEALNSTIGTLEAAGIRNKSLTSVPAPAGLAGSGPVGGVAPQAGVISNSPGSTLQGPSAYKINPNNPSGTQ